MVPGFPEAMCNKENCALPHLSETVVGEIKEKDTVFKAAAAARATGRKRSVGKKGKKDD